MTMRDQIRRVGEVRSRWRRAGWRDVARRVILRISQRLDVESLQFPLYDHDIADSTRLYLAPAESPLDGATRVGWICTPPQAGSGGHTTLFRMIEALESAGHECVIFLYDRHGGDITRHAEVIRQWWPWIEADIRDAEAGITGVDACVASSWQTAHVLATHGRDPMERLYFVQDFEPMFYPSGSISALAEDSYRFGFHTIALGEMVAGHLAGIGVRAEVAPFGCDTSVYSLTNTTGVRSGVVFYARPSADRRGYLLGKRALELFHTMHPEQPIHIYGATAEGWKIPVIDHGTPTPAQLADLYNGAIAGIALSFTNVSLVAEELLACGAIPVVNDSPDSRADLDSPCVAWAQPTAGAIADALGLLVEQASPGLSRTAAASVRHGWGPAQQIVLAALDGTGGFRTERERRLMAASSVGRMWQTTPAPEYPNTPYAAAPTEESGQ